MTGLFLKDAKFFMIEEFILQLDKYPPVWIYIILFVSIVLEYIIPPYPGDSIVVFGAFLGASGVINIYVAFLVTALGSLLGVSLVYRFGLNKGRNFFLKGKYPFFSATGLLKVEKLFHRYGVLLILFNRFIVSLRTIVILCAGIAKMSYYRVLIYSFLSILLWNVLLFYLGVVLKINYQTLIHYLHTYAQIIYILVSVFVMIYLVVRAFKKK